MYNVIDRAIQIHGSLGYTTDLPLESMYRAAQSSADLRRSRRGPQGHRRPPGAEGIPGVRSADAEHIPTRRAAALEKFAAYLDEVAITS